MPKYAVAGALLLIGLTASGSVAFAEPTNDQSYERESAPRIRQEMDRRSTVDAGIPGQGELAASPERANDVPVRECANCPPRNHYDNVEVVKSRRDVDQSRVINTESVVHVRPRVKEINTLVIHENETRNVGVIQHNHRIIEKEIRYVKRKAVYRYAPAYQVVQRVQTVLVPVMALPQPCGCPCTYSGGLFSALTQARTYRTYAYTASQPAMQPALAPVNVPAVHGYR